MIEAVNSVLANAPLLRGNAEQGSSARNAEVQASVEPVQAPFVSPFIFVDNNFDKAVIQIRDSNTGDVLNQFPTEQRLQEISRQQASSEALRQAQASRELRAQVDSSLSQQVSSSAPAPAPVPSVTSEASSSPSQAVNAQVASAALASAAQTSQGAQSTVSVTA